MYKESERLELKKSLNEWREIIISLSAFSNKKGGKIIIGVSDKGEPAGFEVGRNTIEELANRIKMHTDPVLYPSINVKTFGLGEIIEIEISESDNKPVFAFNQAYIRVGKTNQKITNSELRELIKRYTLADFDRQAFIREIPSKIIWDEKKIEQVSAEYYGLKTKSVMEFFKKAGLLNGKRVTNTAYLCFSEDTGMMFNSMIKAARFQGDKMVKFLDMKDYNTNLVSVMGELIKFIKLNTSNEIVISERARHDELWDYPLDALREAIINALVHRDYNDPGHVQIRIFDNRLSIWSPGLLPKEMNVKNLGSERRSIPRNKLLVDVFHRLKIMEGWGSGFQKIVSLSLANGNKIPEFSEVAGAFVITWQKREISADVNGGPIGSVTGGVNLLYEYIINNPGERTNNLALGLERPYDTVEKWIRKLKQENKIEYRGSDKTGGYFATTWPKIWKDGGPIGSVNGGQNGGVIGSVNGGVNLLYEYIKHNPGERTNNLALGLERPYDTVEKWIRKLKQENKIEYRGSDKTGGYYIK
jgi:ATP-dependent DNA helicase RecG